MEIKRWRTNFGFLGNLLCALLIGFALTVAFMPQKVESEMPEEIL